MMVRERAAKVILRALSRHLKKKRIAESTFMAHCNEQKTILRLIAKCNEEKKRKEKEDEAKYERILLANSLQSRKSGVPCKDSLTMCGGCSWCEEMLAYLSTYE